MKKCAICGHSDDGPTCSKCGEASWLMAASARPPVVPVVAPADEPTSEPAIGPSVDPVPVVPASGNKAPWKARRR